jgi:hypothetical protein
MWYRKIPLINPTRRKRRTSRRTPQRLNWQPILRKRTRKIALSATILIILPMNVWTTSARAIKNQQIWLLVKLQKHRDMVIYYLQLFQSVIHLRGVLISVVIYYQIRGAGSLLMKNGSHAHILGVGTVNLRLILKKTV